MFHQIREGLVDSSLSGDSRQSAESFGDHDDMKMSAALRTEVVFVEGALVEDLDVLRLQLLAEGPLDCLRPGGSVHCSPLSNRAVWW